MRGHQRCIAERAVFAIAVPSNTRPDVKYTVKGYIERGKIECSCPAFKFKGACKHTALATEECGWDEATFPEAQTLVQKDNHECPRSGKRTVTVGHGGF